ncbi:MAG TPA: bifunctional tRNA (5-methylaminomethyl-2-thiouridine)(34)-methyltransferase MnmD/FAD-dependent 5-carboxymethylaminomethyl-2-thiouridine(34) oxidoreductase MnmC [Thiobacillaceae bacterium]|nr:bifunctional tRNA (5-methylaminomethyl-2-thiouridine)(34)-methyltransferase MnmD/FAD-dependent 5-carboxymethylaminomethyl-2-thiouridine(34) oxidoreductase MnmC [Thiobacillaceae bacterium]HNU63260.1 bifunctional tRNA (5-methylaminomethyl-2-thiouridine)(34)-methyltransferase MnmD/FAD-dependent 5-carboxymethylaminomethyl-2-thiouridine(34) oxidoreductase MnmC [Thiobacillaceae bacterium]
MRTPILAARLTFDAAGTPVSADYGDIYHAAAGGPGQARHVFLGGNDLPRRWAGRQRFVILENGLGTGLNFLATWAAWRTDPARPSTLHYLAVEKHPFRREDLTRLHARWPEFAALATRLREAWPVLIPGFHRLEFEDVGHRLVLTLLLGEAETCLGRLRASVDAFYLDGFDPRKNPAMWSAALLRRLAQLAAPGATLATWCVARGVRDTLTHVGFDIARRPGYAHKRDMLTGSLSPLAPCATPHAPTTRHALILGGGIAGTALCQRLTARGWQVDLVEGHPHLAGEGSGNLAGIVRPLLSRDDNLASRLSRACFLYTRRLWADLEAAGFTCRRGLDGVLQIARDAPHECLQRRLAAAYAEDYVQFLERDAASTRLGHPMPFGGWWFPQGGWVSPRDVCQALAAAAGDGLRLHRGRMVARLAWTGVTWQALDGNGQTIAQAPLAILASGAWAVRLTQARGLPIQAVRGQVSHVPAGRLPALRHALCREGYLTPALDGLHCLGASYAQDSGRELRLDEHAGNLHRLARLLPGAEQGLDAGTLGGRVGFRAVTPDRLPLVGALPDTQVTLTRDMRLRDMPRQAYLYGLLGLGSRGLVWAGLAAEALASRLHGDPLPLEDDLMDAMDPSRFHLRAHRRACGAAALAAGSEHPSHRISIPSGIGENPEPRCPGDASSSAGYWG